MLAVRARETVSSHKRLRIGDGHIGRKSAYAMDDEILFNSGSAHAKFRVCGCNPALHRSVPNRSRSTPGLSREDGMPQYEGVGSASFISG